MRRFFYLKIAKPKKFSLPIIVVGNISVGGTGKTPFVIWLANFLLKHGYRPGIISRGFGGKSKNYPLVVSAQSDAMEVGDEALVIVNNTNCPMVVSPNRTAALQKLLAVSNCDVIISDDGLQHYKLARDIEIAIVDAKQKFGNGFCLPAGPLREPLQRLKNVDFVIMHQQTPLTNTCNEMRLVADKLVNVQNPLLTKKLEDFSGKIVDAVAGIGNPARFYALLSDYGLKANRHTYPDHYQFKQKDLAGFAAPVIMTEKDAVKCAKIVNTDVWYLKVTTEVNMDFAKQLLDKLQVIVMLKKQ
ncbi:MAG: tetraacyldisaccharide 4'-kinase [Gammaproteobacteria bacterium]|nr:tetraacyldisaccharide 4'-kinase [Gammaproteobacteria bacterium]